jgi:hypothetical protein
MNSSFEFQVQSINNSNTSISLIGYCSLEYISNFEKLISCAYFYGLNNYAESLAILLIIIMVTISNILAIFLLSRKSKTKTVFDKILISHAVMDLITGAIVLPNYFLIATFHFWPLSKGLCMFYVSLDNTMATLCTFHILYMSWVRIRCIKAPKEYTNEASVKYPINVIILMSILTLIFWLPVSIVLVNQFYEDGSCYIEFKPQFLSAIVILFGWIVPVIFIIIITIFIMAILIERKTIKKARFKATNKDRSSSSSTSNQESFNKAKSKFISNPQVKLSIIISAFCIQYLPYSLVWLIVTFCNECVSDLLFEITYLMTFSASFTNPFILLVLNPSFFKSK